MAYVPRPDFPEDCVPLQQVTKGYHGAQFAHLWRNPQLLRQKFSPDRAPAAAQQKMRIVKMLAKGGMGEVYLAEYQADPTPAQKAAGLPGPKYPLVVKKDRASVAHLDTIKDEWKWFKVLAGSEHIVQPLYPDFTNSHFLDADATNELTAWARTRKIIATHWYPMGDLSNVIQRLWQQQPDEFTLTVDMYWQVFRCLADAVFNLAYEPGVDLSKPQLPPSGWLHLDWDVHNVMVQALDWGEGENNPMRDVRVPRDEHHRVFPKALMNDFGLARDLHLAERNAFNDAARFKYRRNIAETGKPYCRAPEQNLDEMDLMQSGRFGYPWTPQCEGIAFFRHPEPPTRPASRRIGSLYSRYDGGYRPPLYGNFSYRTNIYQLGLIMAALLTGFLGMVPELRRETLETVNVVPTKARNVQYRTHGSFVLPSSPVVVRVRKKYQNDPEEDFRMDSLRVLVCQCLAVVPHERPSISMLYDALQHFDPPKPEPDEEAQRYAMAMQQYLLGSDFPFATGDGLQPPPRRPGPNPPAPPGRADEEDLIELGSPPEPNPDKIARLLAEWCTKNKENLRAPEQKNPYQHGLEELAPPAEPVQLEAAAPASPQHAQPDRNMQRAMEALQFPQIYQPPKHTMNQAGRFKVPVFEADNVRDNPGIDRTAQLQQRLERLPFYQRWRNGRPPLADRFDVAPDSLPISNPRSRPFGLPQLDQSLPSNLRAHLRHLEVIVFRRTPARRNTRDPAPQYVCVSPVRGFVSPRPYLNVLRDAMGPTSFDMLMQYLAGSGGGGGDDDELVFGADEKTLVVFVPASAAALPSSPRSASATARPWSALRFPHARTQRVMALMLGRNVFSVFACDFSWNVHCFLSRNEFRETFRRDWLFDGTFEELCHAMRHTNVGTPEKPERMDTFSVVRATTAVLSRAQLAPDPDNASSPRWVSMVTSPSLWRAKPDARSRFLLFLDKLKDPERLQLAHLMLCANLQLCFSVDRNQMDCVAFWAKPYLQPAGQSVRATSSWSRDARQVLTFITGRHLGHLISSSQAAMILLEFDHPENYGIPHFRHAVGENFNLLQ